MPSPTPQLFARELEVAERLAREAGTVALRYREGDLRVELKAGDEPVTVADRASSDIIVSGLSEAFPDDIIISEECADDLRRLEAERVWYVDPIDGTKDFIRGWEGFCVMIGLTVRHEPMVGVLYQPVGDRIFYASPDGGAWFKAPEKEPRRLTCSSIADPAQIRLVASKSHRGKEIDQVKSALGISTEMNIGSVGLKLGLIALGERDLYVNPFSKCRSWDTCAPEAVLDAAGGRMTDLHGDRLCYDQESTFRPTGMVATNGLLHEAVLEGIAPLFPRRR